MIQKEEIEQRRTPKELRDFVARKRAEIEADASERHQGMLKKGFYKEFVDEIMPLAGCAHEIYTEDVTIQPILGNQGYDALVFDKTGNIIEKIEVTVPKFGSENAADARLTVHRGFGNGKMWSQPGEPFKDLVPHILEVARRKAEKDYGDYMLLIVATTVFPASDSEKSHISDLVDQLLAQLKQIPFQAKRVFLDVAPLSRVYEV